MQIIAPKTPSADFAGLPVPFYAARLSDDDLNLLTYFAVHCYVDPAPARRLGDYLRCVRRLEVERRAALDEGCQVLEVSMTPLPTHAWDGHELAGCLTKIDSLTRLAEHSGELSDLIQHMKNAIHAEIQFRLDPHGHKTAGK